MQAEEFQEAGRSYRFHWASNARTVVVSLGLGLAWTAIADTAIPSVHPVPFQESMSLTQRGDSYTGNLRLHDTLGVCTLVLPHHAQTLFCHFATRTL